MIYSAHDPMRGGFRYYEAPNTVPVNNDMPTPSFPRSLVTALGVPASMVGRPLPAGAVEVGWGQFPKGSIVGASSNSMFGAGGGGIPSGIGEYESESRPLSHTLAIGIGTFVAGATLYHLFASKSRMPDEAKALALLTLLSAPVGVYYALKPSVIQAGA